MSSNLFSNREVLGVCATVVFLLDASITYFFPPSFCRLASLTFLIQRSSTLPTSLRSITLIPKGPCEPFGSFANFFDAITTLASFSTPAVHFQCKPFFAASLHRRCIARIGSSFFLSSTMHSILWRLAFFYIFFFRSLSLHQREPGGTRGNQGCT